VRPCHALMLAGATRMRDYAAAGVMAGIAAGAKYPGAAVALAAVSWPWCRASWTASGERPLWHSAPR
jgi:hypothetical protein